MLLRAVLADPQDDVARLVFADWLDENDEPERAELIRLQIKIARAEEYPHPIEWAQREAELLRGAQRPAPGVHFRLSRGLVYSMELPGDTWVRIATAVAWHESQGRTCPRTAQPLESVTLTSWPSIARGPALDEKSNVFRWTFEDDKAKATTANTVVTLSTTGTTNIAKRLLKLRWKWIRFATPRASYLTDTIGGGFGRDTSIPVYRPSLTVRL